MTREELTARKAEAEEQRKQLIANHAAVQSVLDGALQNIAKIAAQVGAANGVIGECDHWLAELDKTKADADTNPA